VRWMLDFDLGIDKLMGAGLRRETREDERERMEGVVGRERFSI
jgi:NAD(P)H-hydrate repair Nnr-like enzyme with NAD(P)H-hydrate epimerase domain